MADTHFPLPRLCIARMPSRSFVSVALRSQTRLLPANSWASPEITAPLDLVFCPDCSLVQITETVPPEILFCRSYPYFSSVSKSLREHFAASAESIIEKRSLNPTASLSKLLQTTAACFVTS